MKAATRLTDVAPGEHVFDTPALGQITIQNRAVFRQPSSSVPRNKSLLLHATSLMSFHQGWVNTLCWASRHWVGKAALGNSTGKGMWVFWSIVCLELSRNKPGLVPRDSTESFFKSNSDYFFQAGTVKTT